MEQFLFVCLVLLELVQEDVRDDAEDQSTGNGGNGNLANRDGHTANTADQDHRYGKQICVVFQVYFLDHLQAGNGDKSVQGDANTAHYAAGNGIKKCYEGRDE